MRGMPRIATKFDLEVIAAHEEPALAGRLIREHAHLVSDDERRALSMLVTNRKRSDTLARKTRAGRWARYNELEVEISARADETKALMQRLRVLTRESLVLKQERVQLAVELKTPSPARRAD